MRSLAPWAATTTGCDAIFGIGRRMPRALRHRRRRPRPNCGSPAPSPARPPPAQSVACGPLRQAKTSTREAGQSTCRCRLPTLRKTSCPRRSWISSPGSQPARRPSWRHSAQKCAHDDGIPMVLHRSAAEYVPASLYRYGAGCLRAPAVSPRLVNEYPRVAARSHRRS